MKTMTLTLLLSVCTLFAASSVVAIEEVFGYYIRLSWIGDPVTNDMDLILRNPKDEGTANDYAALDCYYGQPNPDWGIQDYDYDNPQWHASTSGETNMESIVAYHLFDIGTFTIIARAHTGTANCWIEIIRWRYEDRDYIDQKELIADTASREVRYMEPSKYYDMNTRVIRFNENKKSGKFTLKLIFSNLPTDLPTNEPVRVYLNEEPVYVDDGTHWYRNKSGKKYRIDKPWTMKVLLNEKRAIHVRGFAENIYKSISVNCNVLIGDYLGTNIFRTNKKCKYKYKERKELKNKN